MNKRDDVIIIFQKGGGDIGDSIIIGDPSTNSVVVGGKSGNDVIQTLFNPRAEGSTVKRYMATQANNGRVVLGGKDIIKNLLKNN